jgi:hypothetical protein
MQEPVFLSFLNLLNLKNIATFHLTPLLPTSISWYNFVVNSLSALFSVLLTTQNEGQYLNMPLGNDITNEEKASFKMRISGVKFFPQNISNSFLPFN